MANLFTSEQNYVTLFTRGRASHCYRERANNGDDSWIFKTWDVRASWKELRNGVPLSDPLPCWRSRRSGGVVDAEKEGKLPARWRYVSGSFKTKPCSKRSQPSNTVSAYKGSHHHICCRPRTRSTYDSFVTNGTRGQLGAHIIYLVSL